MRKIRWLVIVCLAIGLMALWFSCVVVDETEYVMITNFGQRVAVYGGSSGGAGLHFKRPWQTVIRIDKRLHVFDPPVREVITGDKRNVEVGCYLVWRVADPDLFLRSAGTLESAESRLAERVAALLSDAIGARDLDALASTNPAHWRLDEVSRDILEGIRPAALRELGLDVVDVRPRSFIPPLEVRPAVFDLIKGERRRVAATLRAEGEAKYRTIVSQAERQRQAILARADAEAERIQAQGEAESTRVLNEVHSRDPKFYEFLRTLEAYRAVLDDQATVILSSASPLLRLLTQGPSSDLLNDTPPPADAPLASPSRSPATTTNRASDSAPAEPKP